MTQEQEYTNLMNYLKVDNVDSRVLFYSGWNAAISEAKNRCRILLSEHYGWPDSGVADFTNRLDNQGKQ